MFRRILHPAFRQATSGSFRIIPASAFNVMRSVSHTKFLKTDIEESKAKSYIKGNPELDKILSDLYDDLEDEPKKEEDLSGTLSSKFDVFKESDSPVIYDIDEERAIARGRELKEQDELEENVPMAQIPRKLAQYNLEHGLCGVFDVEDLVDVLRGERGKDVVVLSVPRELGYVDQIVIVTCMSKKHLKNMAAIVKKLYKVKRNKEAVPRIEGLAEGSEWIAMDLGNIALHCFTRETREHYDLESLWSVGPEYDKLSEEPDEFEALLQTHPLLADLTPVDVELENSSS